MNERKYVLMSIKPQYARLIRSGEKTVELRKKAPKIKKGDIIVIYESTPVMKITSYCEIAETISMKKEELWKNVSGSACISKADFDSYYSKDSTGVGIFLNAVTVLKFPKRLQDISTSLKAPQSYRYISHKDFQNILKE